MAQIGSKSGWLELTRERSFRLFNLGSGDPYRDKEALPRGDDNGRKIALRCDDQGQGDVDGEMIAGGSTAMERRVYG